MLIQLARARGRSFAQAGMLIFLPLLLSCAGVVDHVLADAVSAPASAIVARLGADPMPGDPQTLMTRITPRQAGDSARAALLAGQVRQSITRFRNVADAERAGYQSFPAEPPPSLRIVHYVHAGLSRREAATLDPTQPGALLYERMTSGTLRLVGAMFTATVDAPLEELHRRVPLSMTQWHLHQNVCIPKPVWSKSKWARTSADGRPVFGPGGTLTSTDACTTAGGRFLPTVFGWMAHVYVFADDPADLWNAMYGHGSPHDAGHRH